MQNSGFWEFLSRALPLALSAIKDDMAHSAALYP
jgi:hypothetical protein